MFQELTRPIGTTTDSWRCGLREYIAARWPFSDPKRLLGQVTCGDTFFSRLESPLSAPNGTATAQNST